MVPVSRYGRVLVIATAVTGFAGCAPESIDRPPVTAVHIPDAARLAGVVTAVGDDDLVIDIGTARPVTVALAQVTVTNCDADGAAAFAEGLGALAPVGRAVILVRANGSAGAGHDLTAFVHTDADLAADAAAPVGASVNEELLRTGRAGLRSPLERAATAAVPLEDQVAARAATLPVPDRDYFPALAEAETTAWASGTGPIGACARRQEELDRGRAAVALTTAQPQAPPSETVTVAPTPPPSGLHLEITVQRPSRVRPCERFDRC
ncbi:hypothetical protein [Nocardia bovistercoris]|uniref:Uncharacterized protein n=1 Tax=Nocardia bovistercoris TaxID=2785916 RepID=A0A931N4G6_9NOCA|nr:hypothetical protein [Nocardia bovistercoris]MBH0781730.1 hypothetical protein [Nocardia bovistercoris]